jgi:Flp pilus assembly protein TadG
MCAPDQMRRQGFARDETGAIAVLAAFLLPAVVLLIGMAFDYNTISRVHIAYQSALDETIVAARSVRLADSDLRQFARNHFAGQLGPQRAASVTAFELTRTADGVAALASGRIKAPFFALVRLPHFDINVTARETLRPFSERSSRTTRTR